jgi:hypothetical protein
MADLSGDAGACTDAEGIVTVPVSQGIGPSTMSIPPSLAKPRNQFHGVDLSA